MRSRSRGCIVLLDVPPGSAIALDGVTRVTPSLPSSSFDRGLWIIDDVPTSLSHHSSMVENGNNKDDDNDFHLLVVRPGTPATTNGNNNFDNVNDGGGFRRALPIGFILTSSPSSLSTSTASDFGYDWVFARKYDRYTEEMSNEQNVDDLTLRNVLLAKMDDRGDGGRGELKHIAIPYERFMMMNSPSLPPSTELSSSLKHHFDDKDENDTRTLPTWKSRTSMINSRFLQVCHGISHGSKIVPSAYGNGDHDHDDVGQDIMSAMKNDNSKYCPDGMAISYPPIPCIDPSIDARRLVRHSGTRSYLSALSPEERTRLLFFDNNSDKINSSHAVGYPKLTGDAESWNSVRCDSAGEYVWKDVLYRYYGTNGKGNKAYDGRRLSESERHFLADIELSFILLLHLECQSSLEFWRDAISMCSISATTTPSTTTSPTTSTTAAKITTASSSSNIASRHPQLVHKLLSILHNQLSCIESEFFGDVEYSSGNSNFAILALKRLCNACDHAGVRRKRKMEDEGKNEFDDLLLASQRLRMLARDKFGLDLSSSSSTTKDGMDEDDDSTELDALWSTTGVDLGDDLGIIGKNEFMSNQDAEYCDHVNDDDDVNEDDEDGPVIIPYDEIEASLTRSVGMNKTQSFASNHRKEYPLLYAAMISTGEDEVMLCARILDEKNDVSLVREAAAYLERVEAFRGGENDV